MLKEDSYRNPFADYNANTMNSEQLTHYWENPFENYVVDITESDVSSDTKPIFFTGGRGTGKTMILKHFELSSEFVRADIEKKDFITFLDENKYIGLYLRFDVPLLNGFYGLGLSTEAWQVIFAHFFEMVIAKTIVDSMIKLLDKGVVEEKNEELLVNQINELVPCEGKKLKEISSWFRKEINYVSTYRNSIVFETSAFKPQKVFVMGELTRPFVTCIKEVCTYLQDVNFLVLLDEYENFLAYQQRVVNSILKFADNISFRVGMRPMGFHTYDTVSEDEFIKEKRDYRNVLLENPLIKKGDGTKYIQFLKGLAEKRLKSVPCFSENGLTDLSYFLGESEDPVNEARQITKGRTDHFNVYKEEIKKEYKKRKKEYTLTDEQYEMLRCPDNPLIEMQNLHLLLKPYDFDFVLKAFRDYQEGIESTESQKYKNDYQNKYKLAYVFVLRSIYRIESKQYYGVTDFAYMSSGIAGTFVELCRCAFQYAYFSDRENLMQGHISADIQTRAARDVGKTELDQIKRIKKVGNQVYNFAINAGRLFILDHVDKRIKYVETNQLSFNSSLLEKESFEKEVFDAAVMWSVVQKKKELQQAGIGKDDEEIYVLNRIFAPVFNISARTRGGKNLELDIEDFKRLYNKKEDLDNIKNMEYSDEKEAMDYLIGKRVTDEEDDPQITIFDYMNPAEDDGK